VSKTFEQTLPFGSKFADQAGLHIELIVTMLGPRAKRGRESSAAQIVSAPSASFAAGSAECIAPDISGAASPICIGILVPVEAG
jgi:hypothetical protein